METRQEAVRLCNEEGMSYGDAQLATGIPKSTIHRYCEETVIKITETWSNININ